jgi:murein DD-endopeptidase MepM/ murein hydrolase activator NlpD
MALVAAGSVPASAVTVDVTPASIPQGGSTVVRMHATARPVLTIGGRPARVFEAGEHRWLALWAAALDRRTGFVEVEAAGAGEPVGRATLRVQPRRFRIQRLRMAASTAELYNGPRADAEVARLAAALRTTAPSPLPARLTLPCVGRRSTPFGVKRIRNGKTAGYHRGLDIAAPRGAPVHAAAAGIVRLSALHSLHGNVVVLDHGDGLATAYLHMDSRAVREGERVETGQVVGVVGATGAAKGPHQHWGVFVNGVATDPGPWLDGAME